MKYKLAIFFAVAAALPFGYVRLFEHPSNERDWSLDQKVLPRARIAGDAVTIENLRNFAYRTDADFVAKYETRAYDLRKLDSVWFVVERFGTTPGIIRRKKAQ